MKHIPPNNQHAQVIAIGFGSMGDMAEYFRKQREAADVAVQDWQREIKPGDHFIYRSVAGGEYFLAYVKILKKDSDDETDDNVLFTEQFSLCVPDGEFGHMHRADFDHGHAGMISAAFFLRARNADWPATNRDLGEAVGYPCDPFVIPADAFEKMAGVSPIEDDRKQTSAPAAPGGAVEAT